MLAQWAAARGKQDVFDELAEFKINSLAHCTFQSWFPDDDSEDKLYLGRENHGAVLTDIPVTTGSRDALDFVLEEAVNNRHYDSLSAVRFGHWPIVLTACRCFRLPVPPQVWRELLPAIGPLVKEGHHPTSDDAC
jgi:hypothetical protein